MTFASLTLGTATRWAKRKARSKLVRNLVIFSFAWKLLLVAAIAAGILNH